MHPSDPDSPPAARRDWLAALLLRQPDRFMPRLAAALMRWRTLSRAFRRRFTRRVAATAAGAALVLAMSASPLLVPAAYAATITVDDGVVVVADDGLCSLREAILNANGDSQVFASAGECDAGSGDDIITLPVDGDFLLPDGPYSYLQPQGLPGLFTNITIEGNGSTIRRDPLDPDEFAIALVVYNDATINDVTISGGTGEYGGGVLAYHADTVTISGSTISGNYAEGFGGGIFAFNSDILISGTTISGNESDFFGGGAALAGGTFAIVNSTISGNSANYAVGGLSLGVIPSPFPSEGAIINSTITDNSAAYVGGIFVYGELTLSRSIVSGNRASALPDGKEIYNQGSIYVGDYNVLGHAGFDDYAAFSGFAPSGSDVNATSDGANIPLGQILDTTLADNGGPTLTHNLVLDGPALDMAPDADCLALPTDGVDQRGAARPFDVVGQGNEVTDTCDAGAVEAESPLSYAPSVFMSARAAGTTGDGVDFGNEDILRWNGSNWSLWFDGSAAGLAPNGKAKHNINAFWIPDAEADDDVIFSFAQNRRTVPGIGFPVDGMDLVQWDGSAFSFFFDGSDVGLTNKTQEKIDGLHILPGSESPIGAGCLSYLLISTQGPGKVPNYSGGQLKFGGEDVLGFCATSLGEATAGLWHMVLDGSAEGMPRNSTDSISVSDDLQTLYLTTQGAFLVDAAAGGHSQVYEYDFGSGIFSGPVFDAPAEGLPEKVDGLQMN